VVVVVAVGFLVEAVLLVQIDSVWVLQMWVAPFSWLEIVGVMIQHPKFSFPLRHMQAPLPHQQPQHLPHQQPQHITHQHP
jgi:hypothetical protein